MKVTKQVLLACIALAAVGQASSAQSTEEGSHSVFRTPTDITKEKQPPAPPLAGQLSSIQITRSPLVFQLHGLYGVEISVHNDTKLAVIVDGEHAVAQIGSIRYPAADREIIDRAALWSGTRTQRAEKSTARILVAGASIGAYQLIRDEWIQSGPVLRRYGKNQVRKEDEAGSFAARIIWPGDTRTGFMYFVGAPSLQGAELQVPVTTLFDPSEQAVLLFHM
jgi:hypothetical protein